MNILYGIIIVLPVVFCACPDGWIWNSATCYSFSSEKQAMASATYMCQVKGGHLVDIDDRAEGEYLATVAEFYGHNYWVGLNNLQFNNEWVWLHSMKSLNDTQYQNWFPGQPDNTGSTQHCVIIDTSHNGQWHGAACTDTNRYICEIPDPIV